MWDNRYWFHSERVSLVAQMVKESAWDIGDVGSVPGSGRSPGEGSGYPVW